MCFYFKQSHDAVTAEHRFKAKVKDMPLFQSSNFNGFQFPKTAVITNVKQDLIQQYQWGLIPRWAQDDSIKQYTLNAKIETLTEKPSFKNVINNRCLVVADGFFEWQWLDAKGKQKQKYLITLPSEELFAFAGLWSEWVNKLTGEIIHTYGIVTTEANELMSEIHNTKKRMPVILTRDNEHEWLSGRVVNDFKQVSVDLKAERV